MPTEAATLAPTEITFVPAHLLAFSRRNARRTNRERNIEPLADSILKQGLHQNLVVSFNGKVYPVEGGERRRRAIAWLVKKKKVPRDWPVPVRIIDVADSTAASVTENAQREAMHPADEFVAFHDLTKQGWTIDRIADAFSVTPLVVERRLALAGAAPSLFELLRADKITTEQLIALCATDDHARQESAWRNTPSYYRDAATLRRAVLAGEVDVTRDSRVAFIGGVEVFVAAGGEIRRDLFSADGQGGFIADVPLLERLVAEKLEATALELRAEGWGWVEVWPVWDWSNFHRFGQIQMTATALSPEAAAKIEALRSEYDALAAEADAITEAYADEDELPEEDSLRYEALDARMDEINQEVSAVHAAHQAYEPAAMSAAGAIVAMEGGKLRIERGLVRTADRKKVAEAVGNANAVMGGRETEVSGRKSGGLSDALTRSLYGYRNLAAQSATAANPRVAKVLLACWMVGMLRHRETNVPIDLRISDMGSGTRTQHPISDEGGNVKRKAFDRIGLELIASLPKEDDALWDTLAQLADAELDRLIGFAVASAVSLNRNHSGLTAKLLVALGFNMADHFTPTAANYFSRVSKTQIVDACVEAGTASTDAERTTLLSLKKGDLAARAESDLRDSRWVPPLIRTPPVAPTVEKKAKSPRAAAGTKTNKKNNQAPKRAQTGTAAASPRKRPAQPTTKSTARPRSGSKAARPKTAAPDIVPVAVTHEPIERIAA